MTLQEARDKIVEVLGEDVGIVVEASIRRHTFTDREPIEVPLEFAVSLRKGVYHKRTEHNDLETCVDIALRKFDVEYTKLNSQALLDALKAVREAGYRVL